MVGSRKPSKREETRNRDCFAHYPVQEVHSVFEFDSSSLTPSRDVIGRYPFALRPVLLGASDMPSRYMASSSCDSCAEASLCSV